MADINYWEFVTRADTRFGEWLHLAAGSGFSPNYSNTGPWSEYTAFGVGTDLPHKLGPPDLTAAVTGGAGYFWFGNQSAALGGFRLPAYLNWNVGVTFSQKTSISTCAITTQIFPGNTALSSPAISTVGLAGA
jgi:hypothetical protein